MFWFPGARSGAIINIRLAKIPLTEAHCCQTCKRCSTLPFLCQKKAIVAAASAYEYESRPRPTSLPGLPAADPLEILTDSAELGVAEAEFPLVLLVPAAVRGEQRVAALRPQRVDRARPEEDVPHSAGEGSASGQRYKMLT